MVSVFLQGTSPAARRNSRPPTIALCCSGILAGREGVLLQFQHSRAPGIPVKCQERAGFVFNPAGLGAGSSH